MGSILFCFIDQTLTFQIFQTDNVTLNFLLQMRVVACYITWQIQRGVVRKPVFRVSDQVRHKLGCTAIEDG